MKLTNKAKPNTPRLQPHIQIAVVGMRHGLDPASCGINDAGPVEPYEPKGLVSPSQERPTCDLRLHEIPYIYPTREVRIAIYII